MSTGFVKKDTAADMMSEKAIVREKRLCYYYFGEKNQRAVSVITLRNKEKMIMKRFFKLLLVFCFVLTVAAFVAACGDETATPESGKTSDETSSAPEQTVKAETGEKTETDKETAAETTPSLDVDPASFYKFVSFELPTDYRQAAEDYMRQESQVEWLCTKTFHISANFEVWGIDMTYPEGKSFRGLPYGHTYMPIDEFEFYLDSNRGYYCPTDSWYDVAGVECASSIVMSLDRFCPIAGGTSAFNPADDAFYGKIVGNYVFEKGDSSNQICEKNSPDVMFDAFSKAQKGDVIYHGPLSQHVRLVVDNHVQTRDGKIVGRKSYLTVIEQTNQIDTNKDGTLTTWRVDKTYDYETLLSAGFVPSTLSEYETNTSPVPYIALDKEITVDDLSQGVVAGRVSSGNTVRFVYLDLYGKDGKLVNRSIVNSRYEGTKVDLRKYGFALFANVPSGDYTFVLTAGIAAGTAELSRVEFTYSK